VTLPWREPNSNFWSLNQLENLLLRKEPGAIDETRRGGDDKTSGLPLSASRRPFAGAGPMVRIRFPPPAIPYLPKPRRRYAKSAKHAVSAGLPEKMVLA
jgi:hypothetical protein